MLMWKIRGNMEEENGGYISSKYNVDMFDILKESRKLKNRLACIMSQ